MKHIRKFESYRNNKNVLNEEILGSVINFFKNMWNKAAEEIKKLGKNPTSDKIEEWVDKNPMNPADDGYIFKPQMDEFKKKTEANEQDCLDLIQNLLDPETGCLGKQGLQTLYDGILKSFGKESPTLDIVKYYMETIRNRAIKDYKFAGGPDLKVGTDAKIDPKKINKDMKDTTHLPDFKKVILTAGQDAKKRKQICVDWVEKTLLPRLDKYCAEINNEQVDVYLKSINKESPKGASNYVVGDSVIFKRDSFEKPDQAEWDKLTDDDKKKPNEGKIKKLMDDKKINIMKISKIEGDKISFEGVDFIKTTGDILMKVEAGAEGDESKKTAETLSKIKGDPEKMKQVNTYAEFIQKPENKDKIEQVNKILSGE